MSEKITVLAKNSGVNYKELKQFVDDTTDRLIFDATKLTDLFAPLELGWKERVKRELELMKELIPLLKEMANGKEISGLKIYEKHM